MSPAGTVFEATLDTPAFDQKGNQAETVGEIFWDWWKGLGRERKIGTTVFRAHAARGRVFVKVSDRLEEVERFEVACELIARRWIVPLEMDHGHVLSNATGEPAYQEFTTGSFQWRQIIETLPGEPIDPSEFERITRESRTYADLDGADRFLRLVLQSKPRRQR